MAEYYRILSYLYRYDKKNKMDCKGFIKAEQKNNGLKITLQIDDERLLEDIRLELCFYGKEEDRWRMRRLAVLESSRHHEETVLFYPAEKLPEGFDIRKQYGVILFYQEFFFYGSVWIGDEIPVDALLTAQKEDSIPDSPSAQKEQSHNTHSLEERQQPPEKEKNRQPEPEMEKSEERRKNRQPEPRMERESEGVAEMENHRKPERKTEQEFVERKENQQNRENSREREVVRDAERLERKLSTEKEDLLQNMWIDTEKKAKPVDNIFNPAFRGGYQIAIDQLGAFSPQARSLSDNQFLAKGYALYHHLLAGKVIYGGEERYCVGVPGIYENRERYMAQLYQFPIFLSLTENRIKTGGFGYWLHLLQE